MLALLTGCGGRAGLRLESRHPMPANRAGVLRDDPVQPSARVCQRVPPDARGLGEIAVRSHDALDLFSFIDCKVRRIVDHGVRAPIRFSPDGNWIGYGAASVVASAGQPLLHPLESSLARGRQAWTWLPTGEQLAGVTSGGGVVEAAPGRPPTRLLSDGFGAHAVVAAPDGGLIVARARSRAATDEVWLMPPGHQPRLLYRTDGAVQLFGFVASWLLFTRESVQSSSLAADGAALLALDTTSAQSRARRLGTVPRGDAVALCGDAVIFTAGAGRETSFGKRLLKATAPGWRARPLTPRRLSFVSPMCAHDDRYVAAAAGPSRHQRAFGEEGRSIWTVPTGAGGLRQLTAPPAAGVSDERPAWSRDDRYLLYVHTGPTSRIGRSRGALYLVGAKESAGAPMGPLAQVGPTTDYYGEYGWTSELSWRQP